DVNERLVFRIVGGSCGEIVQLWFICHAELECPIDSGVGDASKWRCCKLAGMEVLLQDLERFAGLALACIQCEYPNKIAHVLSSDADERPPRELTPAFYGCFDWHSSVHGHWLLTRLLRLFPNGAFVQKARAALRTNLTAENLK